MSTLTGRFESAKGFYLRNEILFSFVFFSLGFLYDIVTLSTPDDTFSIVQQVIYLIILGLLIVVETGDAFARESEPEIQSELAQGLAHRWRLKFRKLWEYREVLLHFLFGSLLSVYSLYFYTSGSLRGSFLFLIVMFSLLVLNEIPRFQSLGIRIRWFLFSLCVTCFFLTLTPVFTRHLGLFTFALSMILTALILVLLAWVQKKSLARRSVVAHLNYQEPSGRLWLSLLLFSFIVPFLFILFYTFKILPPIPVALKDIGIYHNIEKDKVRGVYIVSQEKPWWQFWTKGDEDFKARAGEKIFLFVSIYSPLRFEDQVFIDWQFKDPKNGWTSWQKIPLDVKGGRNEGFRGYTYKANYQPGEWRAVVESSDARQMGQISFRVSLSAEPLNLTTTEK